MKPNGEGHTIALVRLSGDQDFGIRAALKRTFSQLEDADIAIIDVTDVPFVDSTFLNEIAALYHRMERRGSPFSIRVVGAASQMRRIFEVSQLDRGVEFWDSVGEAKSSGIVTKP